MECGNGVRTDQGGGWATPYCHPRRNTVTVNRGARVEAGDVLGVIGSFSQANTPHLHFQVERDGMPVDPFTGRQGARPARRDATGSLAGFAVAGSRTAGSRRLWAAPHLPCRRGHRPPRIGPGPLRPLPDGSAHEHRELVAYVVLLGVVGGTTADTVITGPNGAVVFENSAEVLRDFARYFTFAGTLRPGSSWPAGTYEARFVVATPEGGYRITDTASIVLR